MPLEKEGRKGETSGRSRMKRDGEHGAPGGREKDAKARSVH